FVRLAPSLIGPAFCPPCPQPACWRSVRQHHVAELGAISPAALDPANTVEGIVESRIARQLVLGMGKHRAIGPRTRGDAGRQRNSLPLPVTIARVALGTLGRPLAADVTGP